MDLVRRYSNGILSPMEVYTSKKSEKIMAFDTASKFRVVTHVSNDEMRVWDKVEVQINSPRLAAKRKSCAARVFLAVADDFAAEAIQLAVFFSLEQGVDLYMHNLNEE